MTDGAEEHLNTGMRTGYIGFDPTAPSLTIGNFVQIMILKIFQECGHRPVVLMGGATGRIGDPSGRDTERDLKPIEELEANTRQQEKQFHKFLNFEEGRNHALLRNNYDFYKNLNALDFLRSVGKTLTINYMISKESVQRRIETGISYTEFSYQLLQAYDYQCLFNEIGCSVQMGGSDQWGNITSGTEFIRKNLSEKAHAITTPLLTKSDGSKFGKSEAGNIWLDPEMTSPYRFYQFWINSDDKDIPIYTRYFTLKSREQVEAEEKDNFDKPQILKRILAEELTKRVHSTEAYNSVLKVSELLFDPRASEETLKELNAEDLKTVSEEIPSLTIALDTLKNSVNIVELLSDVSGIVSSRSEARRAIQGQAVSINKQKISDPGALIKHENLLFGRYLLLENGKKNKYMILAENL